MEYLDSDLLRSFLAVAETGSITDGAKRIFRSQSAASLQIRKLEDLLGQPVFVRHGRGVALTEAGERLLPVARDVTRTLATTLLELTSDDLHGKLRLGIPDDQSKDRLARIISEFAQSHPLVELDVTCALSPGFEKALASGLLDLAVYEVQHPEIGLEVLREEPTSWMMSRHHNLLLRDPIPVALFDRECWWRDAALESMKSIGRAYRIVYGSQSVSGIAAAIETGIAIGLLGQSSLTSELRELGPEDGFSDMPRSCIVMGTGLNPDRPEIRTMQDAIRNAFAEDQGARPSRSTRSN